MANTISKQTLVDGDRNLVVKVHIAGDASGDEASTELFDVSGFSGAPARVKITRIHGHLIGFRVTLEWDATSNVDILELPQDDDFDFNFEKYGGLINNGGAGVTGDIDITTTGLGSEDGFFVIEMKKT